MPEWITHRAPSGPTPSGGFSDAKFLASWGGCETLPSRNLTHRPRVSRRPSRPNTDKTAPEIPAPALRTSVRSTSCGPHECEHLT